ncbi:hypothetical protein [Dyadobacter sp. LHD-138]|uniref:hypothetical protein n=1 Tax=Dyadobacter sp. LHD-138 TaxID=3071413 RepID=UPI0027E03DB4|nr:hypothetical protein [Dyadobacter sp. LHD-138]MDQ6481207.1 hypothetical protein [Dyadobacter sp. LHD-138]
MLSFFRVNAAYQMISLVVFFLLLRLPFFFGGIPLLIPELSWMLVGEQMNHGFMLYRDVWDNVSPFSGLTYWLIDSLFGRAQWAYQLAAAALGIIQILYFNYVIYSREVFPERTYIPGALYAIFLNISFDLGTLSPMLMANTFLLFAFGLIVKILVRREATNQVFEMGLYIGIATLFYLPASLFMVWGFLALLFYTGATIRHHLLGFFGSLFPLLMVLLYFYMNDGIESLNRNLLTSVFQVKQYNLTDFSSLLASLLLPLGFGILGFTRIFTTLRFVNYQTRIQQVMALWFIVSVFTIPLMQYLAPMQFVIFIPPAAFFATHYFQSFKRKSFGDELQFMLMTGAIVFIQYQGTRGILPGISMGKLENLRSKSASLPAEIKNKRILVLGQHAGEYMENFTATPYLNWDLASYDLKNLDNFDSVIHVYDNFRKDPPDYVIDKANIMPKLLDRVPALKSQYKLSQWKGIYKRN